MQTTALTAGRHGGPEVLALTTFALPPLPRETARIAVAAAGINPVDARRMTGELRLGELPLRFGTEFAGTILEVHTVASGWKVGDEVLGSGADFTHATIIDVPVENLVRRPAALPWAVAGSLAGASQTAVTILARLGSARSLLVHGGAGGVGSLTIQLARSAGMTVVATGAAANQDYLRSLGATPVMYGRDLEAQLEAVHPELFDASIDMAGTEEATRASLARVKANGLVGSITALPPASPRITPLWRERDPRIVERIATDVVAGALRWEVSATYPFADARRAYEAILGRHVRGKSVLTFDAEKGTS